MIEYSNHIVLGTTGGNILVYDIASNNAGTKVVQELSDSNRVVHSLGFCHTAGHILFSGGGDGTVKVWDLRGGNMRPSLIMGKNTDAVRELKCSPFDPQKVAAIYENGSLQRWDIRNPNNVDKLIHAHSGMGLTLDWHPCHDYILTGGRDQRIQVFNMVSESRKPDFVIQTPSAVGRARWQIDSQSTSLFDTSIASSGRASGTTHNIHIWNFRRPHIPLSVIEKSTSYVSDLYWRNNNTLISASRDRNLLQHDLSTESLILDNLSARAFSWSPSNSLSFIVQDKYRDQFGAMQSMRVNNYAASAKDDDDEESYSITPEDSLYNFGPYASSRGVSRAGSVSGYHRRTGSTIRGKPIYDVEYSQAVVDATINESEPAAFQYLASAYCSAASQKEELPMICAQNAQAAAGAGKFRTSQTWSIIQNSLARDLQQYQLYAITNTIPEIKISQNNGLNAKNSTISSMKPIAHPQITKSKIAESLQGLTSNGATPRIASDNIKEPSKSQFTPMVNSEVVTPTLENNEFMVDAVEVDQGGETSATVAPMAVPDNGRSTSFENEITAKSSTSEKGDYYLSTSLATTTSSDGIYADRRRSLAGNQYVSSYTKLPMKRDIIPASNESNDSDADYGKNWNELSMKEYAKSKSIINPESYKSDAGMMTFHSSYDKSNAESESSPDKPLETIPGEIQGLGIAVEAPEKLRFREFLHSLDHPWRTSKLIEKTSEYALQQGDIQLCAVLGSLFYDYFDESFPCSEAVEEWVLSYVNLLQRNMLFTEAAKIVKVSQFDSVKELCRIETTLDTLCHRCMRSLSENNIKDSERPVEFWYCDQCNQILDGCSLCREPVKGLALALLSCGHKLHAACMQTWVIDDGMIECPTGCGNVLVR